LHESKTLIKHSDKGIGTFAPCVAVGDLFQDVGLFGEGLNPPLSPLVRGESLSGLPPDKGELEGVISMSMEKSAPTSKGGSM